MTDWCAARMEERYENSEPGTEAKTTRSAPSHPGELSDAGWGLANTVIIEWLFSEDTRKRPLLRETVRADAAYRS